jgi:hypothetical protein
MYNIDICGINHTIIQYIYKFLLICFLPNQGKRHIPKNSMVGLTLEQHIAARNRAVPIGEKTDGAGRTVNVDTGAEP